MIGKVLIIAPLRICYSVWPAEIEKWKDFEHMTIAILHGPHKQEFLEADADIYIINPEGLEWLLDVEKIVTVTRGGKEKVKVKVDIRKFKKLGFDLLIIDELSKFKSTKSIRVKALKHVLHTFSRRWGLTGSPAPNGLLDLFGQCFMLDQGRSLGQYITHYRHQFFEPSYDGFSWTLREGAEEGIYKRLKPLALTMKADDYIDMPVVIENNIMVQLPDSVQVIYDELHDDLITRIEEGVITAATGAVASMKCRQVASGGIYLDADVEALIKLPTTDKKWVDLHTQKLDALEDLIDELQGQPILIAYDFKHDLERFKKRFGKNIPYIGGGVHIKQSQKLEAAWLAGDLKYLFGHPQAIGHGLNLQTAGDYGARHICFHTPIWDYELYDQFIRRVLRQGNKSKRVFVHHILAENTIDEVILDTLKQKRRTQNALFKALKSMPRRNKWSLNK